MIIEKRFQTEQACFVECAKEIEAKLSDTLKKKKQARLVVSGGRTAKGLLPRLAKAQLDWSKIAIALSDERCVPVNHEESNERLVRRCFKEGGVQNIELPSLVDQSGKIISRILNLEYSDITFLGMGEDGHIASLFPNEKPLTCINGPLIQTKSPIGIVDRVSMSPEALLNTGAFYLVIVGDAKKQVYDRAKALGRFKELPVSLILKQNEVPVYVHLG